MSYKLNIKAFFFNAKTDYLPYYKQFSIEVAKDATAKTILKAIQEKNENFAYPELNLVFKINDLIVEEETAVKYIVEKLGKTLQIDPANSYRANNGLIINNDDFMKSFDLLAPYATESDKKYYKTLYALHYASETEKFEHEYIGDAILVLAHKMISEGNEHKTEILHAITSAHSGLLDCEYENNLFNPQYHTASINALKEMVKSKKNEHPSLLDMILDRFGMEIEKKSIVKPKRATKTIEDLHDKSIAYYAGREYKNEHIISQIILDMDTKEIPNARKNKLSGLSLLADNKTLALKKAGTTLLDAYDAGAEVVVVENEACYKMFEKHFSDIENVVGRKMGGLELISAEDFVIQASTVKV